MISPCSLLMGSTTAPVLAFCLFLLAALPRAATSQNQVHLKIWSSDTTWRHETVHVCSDSRQTVSIQRVNTRIEVQSGGDAEFRLWFFPRADTAQELRVQAGEHLNVSTWSNVVGARLVPVEIQLPSTYTCTTECEPGWRRTHTDAKPYLCEECPSRKNIWEYCNDNPSHAQGMCEAWNTEKNGSLVYYQCTQGEVYHACPSADGQSYFVHGDSNPMLPAGEADCQRFLVCQPGKYRETRLEGQPCVSCQDTGVFGMQGIARGNHAPEQDHGGIQGVHQNASCVCAKGRYYDATQQVCRLCEPGFFQGQAGLQTSCQNCTSCHQVSAYGAESCDGCDPDSEYWSERLRACRPCPYTYQALEATQDFQGEVTEGRYIDVARCRNATLSSQCQTPKNITVPKSTCRPGEAPVDVTYDFADVTCLACAEGKYSVTGQECQSWTVCSGTQFEEQSGNATADRRCGDEKFFLGEPWMYPVQPITDFKLDVRKGAYWYGDVNKPAPTLHALQGSNVTITWPYGHPVMILNDHLDRASNTTDGVNIDADGYTTTVVVSVTNTTITRYYACQNHPKMAVGAVMFHPLHAAHNVSPVLFSDHRNVNLSALLHVACESPFFNSSNDTSARLYGDTLNASWRQGRVKLPFQGVAPCQFQCQPGAQFAEKCHACPAGSYSAEVNAASCTQCEPGKFQNDTGQSACRDCEAEKFAEGAGSTRCMDWFNLSNQTGCPEEGYYVENNQTSRSESNCRKCPEDAKSNTTRTRYGVEHCYARQCDDPEFDGDRVKKWRCGNASADCLPGEFYNGSDGCRDCSMVLPAYATVARQGRFFASSQECLDESFCADGFEKLLELTDLAGSAKIRNLLNNGARCVRVPQECPEDRELVCRKNKRQEQTAFEPQDAREEYFLQIHCISTTEKSPFDPSTLGNCSDFFQENSARRRLLQNNDKWCNPDEFLDPTQKQCQSCPAHTVTANDENVAESAKDCQCEAGYFRATNVTDGDYACHPCGTNRSGFSFYCPGGDGGPCHNASFRDLENTRCRCPDNTSTAWTPTASEVTDCIADAGFRLAENNQVEQCDDHGEKTLVQYRQKGSYDENLGVIVLVDCDFVCRTERYAVFNTTSNQCECDAAQAREWWPERDACLCQPGYQEEAGRCVVCQEIFYCPGKGQEKQPCAPAMISEVGSTKLDDCKCAAGEYRIDHDKCESCRREYFCPDGINEYLCITNDAKKAFICDRTGMAYGELCPPGQQYDRSERKCETGFPINFQNSLKEYYININHRIKQDERYYQNLVINPKDLPELQPLWNLREIEELANFQQQGLLVAELQFFCPDGGVIVLKDTSRNTETMAQAFRCLDTTALQQTLISTATAVPQKLNIGNADLASIPKLRARMATFNPLLDPAYHLSWAVFLACTPDQAVTARDSEPAACLSTCAGDHLQLHLQRVFEVRDVDASELVVHLDTASQYRYNASAREGVVMLGTAGVYQVPGQQGGVAARLQGGFFSRAEGEVKVRFVLHSRTWHFYTFRPVVIRGVCRDDEVLLQFWDVEANEDLGETQIDISTGAEGDICYASNDVFATMHLNRIYVLFFDTTRFKIWSYELSEGKDKLKHTDEFDHAEKIQAVQWHTSCTAMIVDDGNENTYCPLHPIVASHNTHSNESTVYFLETKNFDDNNIQTTVILTSQDIRTNCTGCLPPHDRDIRIVQMALLTPSTAYDTEKLRNDADNKVEITAKGSDLDRLDSLEFLVFAQSPSTTALHVIYAHWSYQNGLTLTNMPPLVVPGVISHIYHTFIPVGTHQHYTNLLAAEGRVVVLSQERSDSNLLVHTFNLSCFSCGAPEAAVYDEDAHTCVCLAGHAPVAMACTDAQECRNLPLQTWHNASQRLLKSSPDDKKALGYANLCLPCSGEVYCTDGSVAGVQQCPPGRHALAARAASERDCVCDNSTKSPGADGEATECVPCDDTEICNANVAQSALRSLPCRSHSRAHRYECECDAGWFPAVEARFTLQTDEEVEFDRAWADVFPFNLTTQGGTTRWRSVKNTCVQCPANMWCEGNTRQSCPEHAVSPPGSTSRSDCQCPAGSKLSGGDGMHDGKCVSCGAPRVDSICVDNKNVSCVGLNVHETRCPCPVAGEYRVFLGGVDGNVTKCLPCPPDHVCRRLHPDPNQQNIPERCPRGSASPPGSMAVANCTCARGFYQQPTQGGSFRCQPCEPNFFCDGRHQVPCSSAGGDCHSHEPHACEADQGVTSGCPPGHIHASKVKNSKDYRTSQYFRDHPLAPEFDRASRQYDTLLQRSDSCVPCPPGFGCPGGDNDLVRCHTAGHYLVSPLGVESCEDFLQPCPTRSDTEARPPEEPRIGIASCFARASLWATRDRSELSDFLAAAFPAAAVTFPVASLDTNAGWAELVNSKNRARFHQRTHTDESAGATLFASADVAAGAAAINISWAWSAFHARVSSQTRRKLLLQTLREIDHGTGVAFEVLLPALWAMALRDERDERAPVDPVVVLDSAVRTTLAQSVAFAAADAVGEEWHRCSGRANPSPLPMLFAVTRSEIQGFASHFLSQQRHAVLYAARSRCAAGAGCPLGVVSFDLPTQAMQIGDRHLARVDAEHALRHALRLDLANFLERGTGACPDGMVRAVGTPGSPVVQCAVCQGPMFARVYYHGGTCVPCHELTSDDCAGLGALTEPVKCSYQRDMLCVHHVG